MFSSKKSFLKTGNYINPNFFIQVVTSFPPFTFYVYISENFYSSSEILEKNPARHNDLTTNKNYFDFLSPMTSFGPN